MLCVIPLFVVGIYAIERVGEPLRIKVCVVFKIEGIV